jgi:hypothetical protein
VSINPGRKLNAFINNPQKSQLLQQAISAIRSLL